MLTYDLSTNRLFSAQPPIFYYKEQKTVELAVFSGKDRANLSDAVSWRASIVSGSTVLCRTLNANIDSTRAQNGILSVLFDTYTTTFLSTVSSPRSLLVDCEIRGTDSSGNTCHLISFRVFACASVDPEGGNPPDVPQAFTQLQADWTETDTTAADYIKNKPAIPSLTGYATEAWVTQQGYLTEHQSLSGYQTKITTDNKLAYSLISGTPTLATVATSGDYNDLSNKPTIPAEVEYATQSEVNAGTVSDKAVSPLTLNNWTGAADHNVYGILHNPAIATASQACQRVLYINGRIVPVSSFTELPAHDFRRCVMSSLANRTIAYYLDPDDSTKKYNGTFNGITSDGSASDLTGTDGDVMVEIPITYWRVEERTDGKILYLVSDQPFSGATVHPFFYVGPGGTTARKQYVGAFESTLCDASGTRLDTTESATAPSTFAAGYKARSVAGAKPWTNMTLATHRTAAANNGGKGSNSLFKQYLLLMMAIEGGTFDTQAGISTGFSYASAWNYAFTRLSGRCNYGNGTGNLLADATQDASITWLSSATASMKIVQFQYRGIENPYGHVWKFEDGIVKVDSGYYWTADDTKYSDTTYTTDYSFQTHTWPSASGYIKEFDKATFFPITIGGATATYLSDYIFSSTGTRGILRGGALTHSVFAGEGGLFLVAITFAADASGARLAC